MLEYARPQDAPRRRFLPPNQSFAGMFAVAPALVLAAMTLLLVAICIARTGGEAVGGICCVFIPCTLAVTISGVLGLTEETPRGEKRDGTLAKWSLLVAAGCWIVVGILLLISRFF